ncbi:hypothetical protein KF840_25680 [bacterium]|nr:hypothetical protein [bacterium]
MVFTRSACLAAVALLLVATTGGRTAAVVCVADCNDDGAVLINELVAAVNVALGGALSACPGADANGDGQVTINELVNAVSDALYGCGVTPPTPAATPTPTATVSPTASPSPSPTPTIGVDVSGHWRSDQAQLQSSTCVKAVTDAVRAAIRNGNFNCDYAVVQRGASADVTETCKGETMAFTVAVAPDGTIAYVFQESDSANGCDVTVSTMVVAPLAQSPTTITGTYDFAFEPSCGLAACRLVVSGRLRRIP